MRVLIIQGPRGSGKTNRLKWHKSIYEGTVVTVYMDDVSVSEFQKALTTDKLSRLVVTMSPQTYEDIPLHVMCSPRHIIKVETLIKEI